MKRFLIALPIVLVACSGSDGSGLLDDSGTPQNDGGADVSTSATDASTDDATNVQDTSIADVPQIPDAVVDVHIGPADSKIQCGSSLSCSAQSETCCWHMNSNTKPYECVSSPSDCAGTYDVPMTCSIDDNCASQGNPSYTCCATGGNYGMTTQCSGYDVATVVACKASCDGVDDYQVGCDVKTQNCTDSLATCIVSKCTVPGDTMCSD